MKSKNKSYKIYLVSFYVLLLIFVITNYHVSKFVDEVQTLQQFGSFITFKYGDLSRAAVVDITRGQDIDAVPNLSCNLDINVDTDIDILTLDDSFFGFQFPEYLQDISGKNVRNLTQTYMGAYYDNNPYLALLSLIDNGYIDEIKPKVIILGSIQRSLIDRFEDTDKEHRFISLADMKESFHNGEHINKISLEKDDKDLTLFSNSNLQYFLTWYRLKTMTSSRYLSKIVGFYTLDRDMFNSNYPNKLFFYQDLFNQKFGDEMISGITLANEKVDEVAQLLKDRSIDLYFMILPDKLTAYQDFVTDVNYERNYVFDEFRKLPREYVFLDALSYLKPHIDNGEKDIYWSNDSHWSFKGIKIAAERTWEEIKQSFDE